MITMKLTRMIVGALSLATALSLSADHHKESLEGEWIGIGSIPNGGESKSTLTIKKEKGKLSATSVNEEGESRKFDRVKFDGKTLVGELDLEMNGQTGVLGVNAKLGKTGELKGRWYANDDSGTELYTGDWAAYRNLQKSIKGSWNVIAETDNGDNPHNVVFEKTGYSYSGQVKGESGELDLNQVSVKKNEVSFDFVFGEGTVKVKAAQTGPTKLAGKWTYVDAGGTEAATGNWKATK